MNRHSHSDPIAALSDDLATMEADIYGIGALGREIAGLIETEQRKARERLVATIAAATLFSTLSATSAAIGFGHTGAGTLVIGIVAGLAAASSALVTGPAPACIHRAGNRLQAWWRQ